MSTTLIKCSCADVKHYVHVSVQQDRLSDWISELQGRSENIEDLVSELELSYNSVEVMHSDLREALNTYQCLHASPWHIPYVFPWPLFQDQFVESEVAMRARNEEMMALVMEQYNNMSVSMEEEKKAKLEQLYDQIVSFQENIDAAKATLETTVREAETDARVSPEASDAIALWFVSEFSISLQSVLPLVAWRHSCKVMCFQWAPSRYTLTHDWEVITHAACCRAIR